MARNIDSIKDRVKKLLDRAADQQGTPEGDACFAKAFDLMSRYGFEERDLKNPDDGDEVINKTFEFRGAYTDMQATLLQCLSEALHCKAYMTKRHRSTKVMDMTVFGLRRHMERVDMLFSLLNPKMLLLSKKNTVVDLNGYGVSATVRKRSFMTGFAVTMRQRLQESERKANAGDERYAVALIDDAAKAKQGMQDHLNDNGMNLKQFRQKRQLDGASYAGGVDAAHQQDIGQTRLRNTPALNR